ncbi:hypothetical protein BGZ75_002501 [Mortierella antarctica]|nr:hypothetical protein BGZ75_002501 [Mortierella antarctica]
MEPYSHKSNVSIAFADIAKGEWACMELTQLGLILNRCPRDPEVWWDSDEGESGPDGEESEEDPVKASEMAAEARAVYAQIGRMTNLEVLELNIDISSDTEAREGDYEWDLTLYKAKGWLRQLAGLKNLRRPSLKADFWSQMRKREMQFILQHWPSLREINLEGRASDWWKKSHWFWLMDMRPGLRLTPDPSIASKRNLIVSWYA